MPFDDQQQKEPGGGHDPHDDLEEVTDAMIDSAVLTALGNGSCVNCAMQLTWVKMTAHMMNSLASDYANRLKSTQGYTDERKLAYATSDLVAARLAKMFDQAKARALQMAQENGDDQAARH